MKNTTIFSSCIFSFFTSLIFLSSCSGENSLAENNSYSVQDESCDVKYLMLKGQAGNPNKFNYGDETAYRYHLNMLKKSGLNRNNRPELFKALKNLRSKHAKSPKNKLAGEAQTDSNKYLDTINMITSLGTTNGTTYMSSGLSSVPGGTVVTHLTLQLYNKDTIPVGNPGSAEQYSGGDTVFVNTANEFSKGDTIISVLTYFYETNSGTVGSGYVFQTGIFYPKAIINNFPADTNLKSPNLILICLNRDENGNCDFRITGEDSPWPVKFPVSGTAVYFDSIEPIQYDSTGNPTNAFVSITLIDPLQAHDGGCQLSLTQEEFFDYVTIHGDSIFWDIPLANFGSACSGNLNPVIYSMYLQLTIQNTGLVSFSITNANGAVPNLNTMVIPPMEIAYGCLAAGSMVRMKGGKTQEIETIKVEQEVVSDQSGKLLRVETPTIGKESKPMIRIKDNLRHSLLLTEGHPVICPSGIKLALELKAGDEIMTESGKAKITSISFENYSDYVWNLKLSSDHQKEKLTPESGTFYANGILVGDARMQQEYERRYYTSSKTISAKLPDRWKKDYQNYLKAKKEK